MCAQRSFGRGADRVDCVAVCVCTCVLVVCTEHNQGWLEVMSSVFVQAWKSPIRNPNWWQLKTDAPEGDTLYKNSPFDMPSRNKCGGYLKECWPQPQDEYGRPLTTAMFTAHSPLSSSPTRKKDKAPVTA